MAHSTQIHPAGKLLHSTRSTDQTPAAWFRKLIPPQLYKLVVTESTNYRESRDSNAARSSYNSQWPITAATSFDTPAWPKPWPRQQKSTRNHSRIHETLYHSKGKSIGDKMGWYCGPIHDASCNRGISLGAPSSRNVQRMLALGSRWSQPNINMETSKSQIYETSTTRERNVAGGLLPGDVEWTGPAST